MESETYTLNGRRVRGLRQLRNGRWIAHTGSGSDWAIVDIETGKDLAVSSDLEVSYRHFKSDEWEMAVSRG